jgi:hypothetical protein
MFATRIIPLLAVLTLQLPAASAQSVSGVNVQAALADPKVKAAMSACEGDRSKLCGTVIPGGGRIIKCLASQEDKVTPACKTAIYEARDSLVAGGVIDPSQLKK